MKSTQKACEHSSRRYHKNLHILYQILLWKKLDTSKSRARTVVWKCCKGDDTILWERGKFDPAPPKNPLTNGHQNLYRWLHQRYPPPCKILSKSVQGVSYLHMHDFARHGAKADSANFFLQKGYSRDARTDFDAKYAKIQGCAVWESQNQYLRFRPPFYPKLPLWGPILTGL